MRTRWFTLKRVVPLISAAALLGVLAAPADSLVSAAPPPPNVASIPAAVQPLIAKIAAQSVNSERYSTLTHAVGSVTRKLRNGKRHKVTEKISKQSVGEASLAPLAGKIFAKGASGALSTIGIGSTLYTYAPKLSGKDGGRPWLKLDGLSAASLFPYHGQDAPAIEVSAGGTGTYAELIDLLATANGAVQIAGAVMVDGQQTTELTASVEPLALIQGASAKEAAALPAKLEVFVTESGLPLRVIRSQSLGPIAITQSTDILAIEVPVKVKAPPARKTLGGARLKKLLNSPAAGNSGTGLKI